MGQTDTSNAFARAMESADSQTLIDAIGEWFGKPYRDPTNALDIAVCVSAGVHAGFALKIDEAKRNWRLGEATLWEDARKAFDAAMCAAVEAVGRSPNPDPVMPRHDAVPSAWGSNQAQTKWGDPSQRPAIGSGWGRPAAH